MSYYVTLLHVHSSTLILYYIVSSQQADEVSY